MGGLSLGLSIGLALSAAASSAATDGAAAASSAATDGAAASSRRNIILILTDDQDIELGGMTPMQKTQKEFENGVKFDHFYVNTPICCPSRMQLLSGRYGHNIRDARLDPFPDGAATCGDEPVESPRVGSCGCMRMDCSRAFEEATYATALRRSGYADGLVGKYLNPPAMASTPQGAYYPSTGSTPRRGRRLHGLEPADYTTSIVGNRSVAYLKLAPKDRPFFLAAAVRAPHAPQLPPPWHASAFPDARVPRDGAYNATPTGKPYWMSRNPPLSDEDAAEFDAVYADRWRALLAVDDLVAGVFDELRASSLIDDTYVFYTSDHGYHMGHFRLPPLKMHKYEFDIRVPLLATGPGLAPASRREVAGFVDLAPTFLAIAGAAAADGAMDGTSLLPLLEDDDDVEWREEMLVEYAPITNWLDGAHRRVDDAPDNNFRALRIVSERENALYAETTSLVDYDFEHSDEFFIEYYDLRHNCDPHQLHNLADKTSPGTSRTSGAASRPRGAARAPPAPSLGRVMTKGEEPRPGAGVEAHARPREDDPLVPVALDAAALHHARPQRAGDVVGDVEDLEAEPRRRGAQARGRVPGDPG
ncbi:sulfuric ester hydrolase [Aureococcus anophagefferens]|nr:sulfuric ester hydrolase [Aureococcus anophagefferens]